MVKGSDIIGKPIVTLITGTKIEEIRDVIFDVQNKQILGFLIDEPGIFSNSRVLPFSYTKAIGVDAVTVEDMSRIIPADTHERINEILTGGNVAKGTRVMTEDGKDLGKITDVYFNENTGAIEGYELSGGLLTKFRKGSAFIPTDHLLRIGQDIAFVKNDTPQYIEETKGGVEGTAQNARSTYETWRDYANEKTVQARETIIGKQNDLMLEETKGEQLAEPVVTDDGMVIGKKGDIVTDEIISRARQHNKEKDLVQAANISAAHVVGTKGDTLFKKAEEKIAEGVNKIQTKATETWEHLQQKAQETSENAQGTSAGTRKAYEKKQIDNAVGRPVSRVILDKNDHVILNAGDLITYEVIARAKRAGVLDILLNSVTEREPPLSREDFRKQDL